MMLMLIIFQLLFQMSMSAGLGIMGTWRVTYNGSNTADYIITQNGTQNNVHVVKCSWNTCNLITNGVAEPSDKEALPSNEGWWKVKPIHRSTVWLYFKVKVSGQLQVLYFASACSPEYNGVPNFCGNDGYGIGIHGKDIIF